MLQDFVTWALVSDCLLGISAPLLGDLGQVKLHLQASTAPSVKWGHNTNLVGLL